MAENTKEAPATTEVGCYRERGPGLHLDVLSTARVVIDVHQRVDVIQAAVPGPGSSSEFTVERRESHSVIPFVCQNETDGAVTQGAVAIIQEDGFAGGGGCMYRQC